MRICVSELLLHPGFIMDDSGQLYVNPPYSHSKHGVDRSLAVVLMLQELV